MTLNLLSDAVVAGTIAVLAQAIRKQPAQGKVLILARIGSFAPLAYKPSFA